MNEEDNYQINESTATSETAEENSAISGYSRQHVLKIINAAKGLGAISIDLSQKNLESIPPELYDLEQIEYLYLEGNALDSVPAELFERLPNLKWLDLRYNKLMSLSTSCRKHRCLKTLLLEDNCLSELPPELGLIKSLTGLSLRNNPLEFPPSRIIEKGVKEILKYLRDSLTIKDQKFKPTDLHIEDLSLDGSVTHSSESEPNYISRSQWDNREISHQAFLPPSRQSMFSLNSNSSDLEFPRPLSVSLHKHMTYEEYRQLQYEKFKRAGALGVLGREKRRKRKNKKHHKRSSAPAYSMDPIEAQFMEEQRLEKLRQLKQRQTVMEQRVKDQRLLEDWRDESKEMQRKHYIRAVKHGRTDFSDPVNVPYDMDPEYLQILSKEERIKKEVKTKYEKMQERGNTGRKQIDRDKLERDRQLMEKIKLHTQKVHERKTKPKGNPQEEMAAAKRDLELANELHKQVNQRTKELEYRFRAFTGDSSPVPLPPFPYKT